LVNAGHDPATQLHAYRGNVLCLLARSIGEAAELEINGSGTVFRRRRETDAASLVRQNGVDVLGLRGRNRGYFPRETDHHSSWWNDQHSGERTSPVPKQEQATRATAMPMLACWAGRFFSGK
jgi:hypothetical protein